jgi:hypothetical protein
MRFGSWKRTLRRDSPNQGKTSVVADRYEFFLSRRGSVAEIAQEVADVLTERGYKVIVQDYDFRSSESVIERMHEGIKNSRDLIILF